MSCETPSVTMDTWAAATPLAHMGSPKGMTSLEWDDDILEALPYDEVAPLPGEVAHLFKNYDLTTPSKFFRPESPPRPPVRELTEEDKEEMFASRKFYDFFMQASRLIERALDEDTDIFFDYSGANREDTGKDQELLKFHRDFFDERWSVNRTVTALDWSAVYPELLLTAYDANEKATHEPEGVCLIWNLKYKKTSPEYVFNFQTAITAAILTEFHPSLVIGGTYTGQIVLWDTRSPKRTPVQRTPLSCLAHAEPIKALAVTGSQNAHNLISVSSDGKLCSWSLDMLGQPQQSLELTYRQAKTVSATSMAFFPEDANNFLIGALDGSVYSGCRHGNKAGISDQFEGHRAPITSVCIPCVEGTSDSPPLFLTTSMDCSVKLWSKKHTFPIFSFDDRINYFLDCDWSPVHPALFATVDLSGQLDVWNLNQDHEVPTASSVIEGEVALNHCRFDKKGSHIAVGDDVGKVYVFDLHEKLATPRPDEWTTLSRLISNLSATASELRDFDSHNHRFPTSSSIVSSAARL
ncbi:Cytoplasmic dynein 1 intermediate chain 2 [Sparganum proliferum]